MVLQYALCCRKPTRLAEDEVPAGTYDCHHHVNNMSQAAHPAPHKLTVKI